MSRIALVPVFALLTACGLEGGPVAREAQLLVPEDVELHWDDAFNHEDDGLTALVPVDVMVYDGQSGEPVRGAVLQLRGSVPGALVAVPEGVHIVGPDEDAFFWDAWRDRYFELTENPDLDPATSVQTQTDETGLARVYVFVDRFSVDDEGVLEPARVTVTLAGSAQDASFFLVPR